MVCQKYPERLSEELVNQFLDRILGLSSTY